MGRWVGAITFLRGTLCTRPYNGAGQACLSRGGGRKYCLGWKGMLCFLFRGEFGEGVGEVGGSMTRCCRGRAESVLLALLPAKWCRC